MSLTVLAVVGGALAFKARGIYTYCTSPVINGICPQKCPHFNKFGYIESPNGIFICTTTSSGIVASPCEINGLKLDCTTTLRRYQDNQ
jgi:hypothetical protein